MSVGHLHHGEADNLVAQFEALLEDGGDGVLAQFLAVDVHDSVVEIGVEFIAHIAEDLHTQTVQNLDQFGHGQLNALLVGGIFGGLVQRPFQIVVNGEELGHSVGLAVAIAGFLFLDGTLAEIVVLRSQTQVCVPLGVIFLFPGIDLGNLLRGGFLYGFFHGGLFCFLFLLCHDGFLLNI